MKYNAFISYSHSQDSDLAPSLEKALEKLAKPTFKRRALNIFRDSNDLSVSPDLWGKIEEGLNQSEYFIFFASPKSAQSHYCGEEVKYWLNNKSIDHFLIALTDGDIIWDFNNSDFDWNKTTAIPKILSGAFKNEPLYVDFRGDKLVDKLNLDNPDFKAKAVLFAATLHGKKVGDMVGETVKQHKRTLRIRNSAVIVLFSLMTLALYLTVSSIKKKDAMLLHFQALSLVDKDPTIALRLEEEALRLNNNTDYEKSAINIYKNYPYYKTISANLADSLNNTIIEGAMTYNELYTLYGDIIQQHTEIEMPVPYYGTLSKDSINLFLYQPFDSGRNSSRTGLLNLSTNDYIPYSEITSFEQELTGAIYTPGQKNILTLISNGNMELWDLFGNKQYTFTGHKESISSVSFSDNVRTILTCSFDGTARLWDFSGNLLKLFSSKLGQKARLYSKTLDEYGEDSAFINAHFSQDNRNIITSFKTSNDKVSSQLWDWNKGKVLEIEGEKFLNDDNVYIKPNLNSGAFSPDGKFVLAGFNDGQATMSDLNGKILQKFAKEETDDFSEVLVAVSPNRTSILLVSYNKLHVLAWKEGAYQTLFIDEGLGHGSYSLDFFHAKYLSENSIIIGHGNSRLEIRNLENTVINTIETKFGVRSLDISPDGQTLLLGSAEGLFNYNLKTNQVTSVKVKESAINAITFSPDGTKFLIGGIDFIARLYNTDGTLVQEFPGNIEGNTLGPEHKGFTSLAFSPDGSKILTGSDYIAEDDDSGSVILWDIDGERIHEFIEIKDDIATVEFSHDGRLILVIPSMTYNSFGPERPLSAYVYDSRFQLLKKFLDSDLMDRLTEAQKEEYGVD